MLLSRLLADFTRGESDALRKAMGKKKKDIVDAMKPKFIEGGVRNGHDPKILEKIWGDWEKFASYAFNKSHAACYSWVAYQTAYLKAHYPAEFMAALLTRRKDDIKEITKLLDECKALKIEVMGPDVNESHTNFGVNSKSQIRFGLMAIKGLGESAAEAIVQEREKNGPYKDIFDFVQRVPMSSVKRSGMECLAVSGAFDSFKSQIRREQFLAPNAKGEFFLDTLTRYGNSYQQSMMEAEYSLFGADMVEVSTPPIPPAESWSALERLNRERELVGVYLSAHPLDEYAVIIRDVCTMHATDLEDPTPLVDCDFTLGGIVTNVKTGISKRGSGYGIVTLEDYSGQGELALWGQDWAKWGGYMMVGSALYITGRVQPGRYDPTKVQVSIGNIQYLHDVKDDLIQKLTIHLNSERLDEDTVLALSEMLKNEPGKVALEIVFHNHDGTSLTMRPSEMKIRVTRVLMDFLQSRENIEYSIN
jgi:DNA polymerase-3 subunit alpha